MILLLQMSLIFCNGGQIPEVVSRIVRGESHVRRALELSKFGDMERGYCVRANGEHQKSHVTKAGDSLEDVYSSHPNECLLWCMSQTGLTGCEFVWSKPDQGCFAHRGELSHASSDMFVASICWISTNPPANAVNEVTKSVEFVQVFGEGTCETLGRYKTITDGDTCEAAARFLDKQDTTVNVHRRHGSADNRPFGCTYHQFQNLELWTESTGVCTFGVGCLCELVCSPDDIVVEYTGSDANIQELVGRYKKRTDCERTDGGAWFGGADFSVCFEGPSSFMIWNTGCGWQIGLTGFNHHKGTNWDRRASTYAGQCSEMPEEGLTTKALTTQTYTNDLGKLIPGLTSHEQKNC